MSKFKVGRLTVGDRVKCIGKCEKPFGKFGSIIKDDGSSVPYIVAFDDWRDGHGVCDNEWWLAADQVEPALAARSDTYTSCAAAEVDNLADEYGGPKKATALRIEAGKFYKTRDGRKVGPMLYYEPEYLHVESGLVLGYVLWHGDGTSVYEPDPDLIAEWTDEPVAAAPKFKVGDRVKQKHWSDSNWSTVTRFDGTTLTIRDDNGFTGKYDNLSDFETKPTTIADIVARHSQSGTAIVAILDNGQPRPATRPYVHTTASAAETEANRLARTNPGKEFGVYTLGAVAKVEKTYDHEWQRLAAGGEVIGGVKELRRVSGLGLATAKDAVEDWLRRAA